MRAALRQGLKRLRNQTSLRSFSSKKDEILSSSASYATPDSLSASSRSILYRSHMPTSPCQKTFIAVYSAFKALSDPEKGDMVAALGETTGVVALQRLRKQMQDDPVGRELLEQRPNITDKELNREALRKMAPGTLGRAYSDFMDEHGFSADERTPVRFVDDDELAFVIQRYRQVHDFWHVLSGLPTTVLGEISLKWFELIQTGLPVCGLSAIFGPLALNAGDRMVLRRVYIPWAIKNGRNCKSLINFWYERNLEMPVDEVRRILNIEAAPKP